MKARMLVQAAVAVLLAVAPPGFAPPAAGQAGSDDPVARDLRNARTTFEFLTAARRYHSMGRHEQAKAAVDRAAAVARWSSEWHSVSASYRALGYSQQAEEAFRKALGAPLR